MKKQTDQNIRDIELEVDDLVYLKIKPYRQRSIAKRRCEKLAPRYYGPYKILQRVDKVAYRLELLPSSSIHDVFHVSQLKKAVGQSVEVHDELPPLSEDFEWLIEPVARIGIRWNEDTNCEEWLI